MVVVGGGTAGWLTAGVLAADHGAALQVSVVESPEIATIGVGEGTWPSLRDTLRRIGVSESDLFRECDAAFKQGSRFDRWATGADDDRYFHPFMLPLGYSDANLVAGWLRRHGDRRFADLTSVQPHLCARHRAPKQAATPEYAAVANYAYHLDAVKLGVLLRQHCTQRLGVRHVQDHVVGVDSHDSGDIAAVRTRAQGTLAGDLFIDCTGLHSLLLGGHFGIGQVSQRHVLFNDRALAAQVPYPQADAEIASQTTSTAQSCGWIWDIGLPTRRGVGHVYSSAHTSDDQAERALRDHIAATGGPRDFPAPRRLAFAPGYRERFWHRNCIAVGLSAGFIEPLEASAIALVELSAAMISDELPATRATMDIAARRFNETFGYRWERVIEFLKLHYALTRRTDSAYWRDHVQPGSIPERLRELLLLWRQRPPSRRDLPHGEEIFPSASYQYVLYGMGFRPDPESLRHADDAGAAEPYFRETAQLAGKMLAALPGNRELVAHIARSGLPRI